eukprot:gene11063-3771_t
MDVPEQIEKEILEIFNLFSVEGEIENSKIPEAMKYLGLNLKKKPKEEKLKFDQFLTLILNNFDVDDEKLITGFDLFDFDKR